MHAHIHVTIGKCLCLFCLITSEQIRSPDASRRRYPLRSLESMAGDYQRFLKSGGNYKHAKRYSNCIREALFNIPLTEVS